MNARLLALLLLVLPAAALANTWVVTRIDGTSVMGESSALTFEVRNASSSLHLNEVTFTFPAPNYTIDGGDAPPGWVASTVDRQDRRIIFTASGINCAGAPVGIAPGATARFVLRIVGVAADGDVLNEALVGGNSSKSSRAREVCSGTVFAEDLTLARWNRVGLSSQLTVQPRTLQVGGNIAVQFLIVNRSLQTQSGITLSGPTVSGSATFSPVSGFSPASLTLAPGATGAFTGELKATGSGTAFLRASASNGGAFPVSTRRTSSLEIDVSDFPALAEALPSSVVRGDTVTVRLNVSNPSSTTYSDVKPGTPVFSGTAVPTLLSGPTPALSSALAPGSSISFIWKYQMNGAIGATYQFTAQADAVRNGQPLATSAVTTGQGLLVEFRMLTDPPALASGSLNRTIRYTLHNGGSTEIRAVKLLEPDTNFFKVSATPFLNDTSGWTQSTAGGSSRGYVWTAPAGQPGITQGTQKTFSLDYASLGTVSRDTTFSHQMELTLGSGPSSYTVRVDAPVTLFLSRVIPEVESLVALAGPNRTTLTWTNPSDHDGVLILRAQGAAPNTAPVAGTRYAVGSSLGNAQVVYTDELSVASTFVDSGLTNGTTYFYKVFNHDALYRYAAGNVPQSLGLKSIPTGRGPGEPLWCYSVGFSTLQQPITELGVGIFSSSTSGSVTANLSNTSNSTLDGGERWRPVRLQAPVQSRFPLVPLNGLTGQYIITGDQDGYTYGIRAETGEVLWRGNGGGTFGAIQSFPVVQLHDFANTAYKAAHPNRDLAFFATRLSTGITNRVFALNARTGQLVWTYAPGDLGMVSGGMLIDYVNNRLYVGARSNGNTLASLRVLNSLTGAELARLSLGDIDFGIIRSTSGTQAYVTNSDGTVYGVDLTTMKVAWSAQVASRPAPGTPAFASFARPVGAGFIVSILGLTDMEGRVERYNVATTTNPDGSTSTTVTKAWSTPIGSPSGTFSHTVGTVHRIYVGSKDGKIHELDYVTGADGKQVALPGSLAIGTPTVDRTVSRLHVGTQDGRICAFPVPF